MTIHVRLFAVARQLAGDASVSVQLPDGATVAQLKQALADQHPALENVLRHARFAVDTDYVADHVPLAAGADVACIPPVSGG